MVYSLTPWDNILIFYKDLWELQRRFLFVSSQICIILPVWYNNETCSRLKVARIQISRVIESITNVLYYSMNLLYLTIAYQLKVNMMNNDIEFPFYNREGLFIVGIPYLIYFTFQKHFPSMGPYKCFTTILNLDVDIRPNVLKVHFIILYCMKIG